MEKQDAGIFLESGINSDNKPINIHDDFIIERHNECEKQNNHQYQHNGKGTIITVRKDVNT